MRPQRLLITAALFTATATLLAGTASADSYSNSISACEDAIGERLGIDTVNARYNVKKIKSRGRFQDIKFSVSVFDKSHPVQSVKAKCRAKANGEIVAVEFDSKSLPASIAVN